MNIKELKKEARKNLKRNYFKTILVVFIASIIINGGYKFTSYIFEKTNYKPAVVEKIDDAKESVFKFAGINVNKRGLVAPFINNIYEYDSVTVGTLKTINHMVLKEKISDRILNYISLVITLLVFVFIQNIINVGEKRYLLEQRRYNTKVDKVLFVYQAKKTFYVANIMFKRFVYQILWFLTIYFGPIKYYEYKLIPYILANNPDMDAKEAFSLSKELSDGHKMEMFLLDISLIGYYVLNILTLGLSSLFYFNAYKRSIYTEIYMYLRSEKDNLTYGNLLDDSLLDVEEYTNKEYKNSKYEKRKILKTNYEKSYSLSTYILLFFTFSICGWIWEILLEFVQNGNIVNRGSMAGPWLPIYGFGSVFILFFLKPVRNRPFLFLVLSMILCGILEYTTSWYLETINGMRWWEYDGYFLNINGRICFEGLLVFTLAGAAVTYLLAPIFSNIYERLPKKLITILCIILVTLYGIDLVYSHINPNTGNGITYELNS